MLSSAPVEWVVEVVNVRVVLGALMDVCDVVQARFWCGFVGVAVWPGGWQGCV